MVDDQTLWLPSADDVREEMPGRKAALQEYEDPDILDVVLQRAQSLAAELPDPLPLLLHPVAKAYLTYSTAAVIEDRLFPEQSSIDGSNAQRLDLRAGAELARLRAGLNTIAGSTGQEWAGSISTRGLY